MDGRVLVEIATGLHPRAIRIAGGSEHGYVDCTDLPAPTVVAGRPVSVIVQPMNHRTRAKSDKPPYAIPTMDEIAALEPNGYRVASTFSGCGGSSLGYRMAGYQVLYANEFIPAARETYKANAAPGTVLDGRDIRQVTAADLLARIGLEPGELDLLDGSPPCASFSTAGKRSAGWGHERAYSDTTQRTDDLFFEFVRLVDGVRPKVFVAENVSGLIKGVGKGYFLDILKALKAVGYKVEAKLLDAQWLGVPQARQRIIFIGVRDDLPARPAFPIPLAYRYTIRDALPWIGRVVHDTSGLYGAGDVTDRPSPAITVGVHSVNSLHFKVEDDERVLAAGANGKFGSSSWQTLDAPARTIGASPSSGNNRPGAAGDLLVERCPPVEPEADISRFEIGKEWDKIEQGGRSDRYFQLKREAAHKPSRTITADGGISSLASVTHPTERRKFSIAELKRICGFPDDFIVTGTYAQQWERLGRAVPPLMMAQIAETIRDRVLARCAD